MTKRVRNRVRPSVPRSASPPSAEPDCTRHIFLNLPFDAKYSPLLRALIFCVSDSGYWPRCMLEDQRDDVTRQERLQRMVMECQYGIHELCRVEVTNGCPRFNMPYELGLFHGSLLHDRGRHPRRAMLVMESVKHRHLRTISDLAGMDVKAHGGTVHGLMSVVRNFLKATTQDPAIPPAEEIEDRYREFCKALPRLMRGKKFKPNKLFGLECYGDYCEFVRAWIKSNPCY